MKTFKQFISEKPDGTYVAVRFSDESNKKLKEYAESLGLTPIKDFHSTIVYSIPTLDTPKGTTKLSATLHPKKLMYLGEVGNEYRALVIEVESDELQREHDNYVDKHGYKPRFESFLKHVSLAYSPKEGINIDELPLPDFKIDVVSKYVQTLHE